MDKQTKPRTLDLGSKEIKLQNEKRLGTYFANLKLVS